MMKIEHADSAAVKDLKRAIQVVDAHGLDVLAKKLAGLVPYVHDLEEVIGKITSLEAQLAARNQAAEAMGVLEQLVPDYRVTMCRTPEGYEVRDGNRVRAEGCNSLIGAVLKAGGE